MRRWLTLLLTTLLIFTALGTVALAVGDGTITVEGVVTPVSLEGPHYEVAGYVLIGPGVDFSTWNGQAVQVTGRVDHSPSIWMRPMLQVTRLAALNPPWAPPVTGPAPPVTEPQPPVVMPQPPVVMPQPPVVMPQPPVVMPQPPAPAPHPPIQGPPPVQAPQPPHEPDELPRLPQVPPVPLAGTSASLLFGVLSVSEVDGVAYYSLAGHNVMSESVDLSAYVGEKVAAAVATTRPMSIQGPRVLVIKRIWVISGDLGSDLGRGDLPYTTPPRPIRIMIQGRAIPLDAPVLLANGRTLVPVRLVTEALGAQVSWDGERQLVTVRVGATTVLLAIGSNQVTVTDQNGITHVITVEAAPVIVNGRTEVPLRLLAEAFGFVVNWDPDTYTVSVQ